MQLALGAYAKGEPISPLRPEGRSTARMGTPSASARLSIEARSGARGPGQPGAEESVND